MKQTETGGPRRPDAGVLLFLGKNQISAREDVASVAFPSVYKKSCRREGEKEAQKGVEGPNLGKD